jgi:hypothetical protein
MLPFLGFKWRVKALRPNQSGRLGAKRPDVALPVIHRDFKDLTLLGTSSHRIPFRS